MDLTLFHPPNPDGSPRNFHMKDKLNGWTKRRSCRFLEWTGWYNYSLRQRMLGHYRLFHHFKARYPNQQWEFSAVQTYIVEYRSTHDRKLSFYKKLRWFHTLGSPKDYYTVTQVAAVNHMLLNKGAAILHEFLAAADTDFAAALTRALEKINDPAFLDNTALMSVDLSVLKMGAKGKEKGVFSKRQMLLFFDLLSELGGMEKIDLKKTARYANLAALFHAITGKSKESIVEELNDYRHKTLYECKTDGEIDQLVIVLTNLSTPFKQAGFKAFSDLVDKKIVGLMQKKKR